MRCCAMHIESLLGSEIINAGSAFKTVVPECKRSTRILHVFTGCLLDETNVEFDFGFPQHVNLKSS